MIFFLIREAFIKKTIFLLTFVSKDFFLFFNEGFPYLHMSFEDVYITL